MRDQFGALYERGIAVGELDIKHDTMHFKWRDEEFSFPSFVVYRYAEDSGYGFYTMPVQKLRELRKEAAH